MTLVNVKFNNNLWRYTPTKTHNEIENGKWLRLRESEKYISLYHSNKQNLEEQIAHIDNLIRLNKDNPCIYRYFDFKEALIEINRKGNLIKFKEENYPHIGLYFLVNDELTLIKIRNSLLEISKYISLK